MNLVEIIAKIDHYKNNSKQEPTMAVQMYKSVTELFKESSQIVRRNLATFILINILSAVSVVWQAGLDLHDKTTGSSWHNVFTHNLISGSDTRYPGARAGIIFIIFVIAGVILYLMNTILTVRAARKDTVSVQEVWEEFKIKGARVAGVLLLTGLIVIVGLLLIIIPGIYFLGRLAIAPALLIDQNVGVREAINRSWELTKGQMAPVYTVILFSILLSLTGIIPVIGPIVSFGLALLYSVALPLRYFELKAKAKA